MVDCDWDCIGCCWGLLSLALSGDGGRGLSTETGELVLELRGLVGEETQSKGTSSPFAPPRARVTNHCCHNGRTYQLIAPPERPRSAHTFLPHAQSPEVDVKKTYVSWIPSIYYQVLYYDASSCSRNSCPLSIQFWTSQSIVAWLKRVYVSTNPNIRKYCTRHRYII